jgi:hypothetical protein
MRVIKGTQDARKLKGVVQASAGRVTRCPCGGTAKQIPNSKKFGCGKCGRVLTTTAM